MPYLINRKYYAKIKLQGSTLVLGAFYNIQNIYHRYLICIGASALIGLIYWLFIQYTGVYSAGLSAITQGISRLVRVLIANNDQQDLAKIISNILFWTLFSFINIPLVIFSYQKIGKHFTKMTVAGFLTADITGLILGFIPKANEFVLIFGNPLSNFSQLADKGVQILSWDHNDDLVRIIPLFFYALVSSLLLSLLYAIIFIVGGSTGGTDFISYYYSVKKQKKLGTIFSLFNTGSLFLGTIIGSYISASLIKINNQNMNHQPSFNPWSFSLLFSPNFVISAVASLLFGILLNWLFPKYKMSKITVYSNNITQIAEQLIKNGYSHTFTIYQGVGAYSKNQISSAETICQYIEVSQLIRDLSALESNAIISVQKLDQVQGPMNILEKID